jgi:hypothetical protein
LSNVAIGTQIVEIISLYSFTGNTEAPVFIVLNHVEVEDGGIVPLHLGLFYISDTDTAIENLFVVIVTSPTNGDLVKVIEGRDVEVKAGLNISVADLMMGKVRFRHHAGKAFKGLLFYFNLEQHNILF